MPQQQTYKIIVSGTRKGQDPKLVQQNLAKLFKTTPDKVAKYLQPKPQVLKSVETVEQAKQYHAALHKIGLMVQVKAVQSDPPEKKAPPPTRQAQPQAPEKIPYPPKVKPKRSFFGMLGRIVRWTAATAVVLLLTYIGSGFLFDEEPVDNSLTQEYTALQEPASDTLPSDQDDAESAQASVMPAHGVGQVQLPPGYLVPVTEIDVSLSPFDEAFPNQDGSFTLNAEITRPTMLTALIQTPESTEEEPDYSVSLTALLLPGEEQPELSTSTTALSLVWYALNLSEILAQEHWQPAKQYLASHPKIQALSRLLDKKLGADAYLFAKFPLDTEITSALNGATETVRQSLPQQLGLSVDAGQLSMLASLLSTPAAYLLGNNFLIPTAAAGEKTVGEIKPVIPPDICVDLGFFAGGRHCVKVEEEGDSGNIRIRNEFPFYLSAKIAALDKEQKITKVLQPHISGYTDAMLIEPNGLKTFEQPQGSNSVLYLVTAGMKRMETNAFFDFYNINVTGGDNNLDEFYDVRWSLFVRSWIEGGLYPALSTALGSIHIEKKFFVKFMVKFLAKFLPDKVNAANKLRQGNPQEAAQAMSKLLESNDNSLLGDLQELFIDEAQQYHGKRQWAKSGIKLGRKIRLKFKTPWSFWFGVGMAAKDIGVYAANLENAPEVMKFTLTFPPRIDSVSPNHIVPDSNPVEFTITGKNFAPVPSPIPGELDYPQVYFIDDNGDERSILHPNDMKISEDGNQITVEVLGGFLREGKTGYLDVKIVHPWTKEGLLDILENTVKLVSEEKKYLQGSLGVCGYDIKKASCGYIKDKRDRFDLYSMMCQAEGEKIRVYNIYFKWIESELVYAEVHSLDKKCDFKFYKTTPGIPSSDHVLYSNGRQISLAQYDETESPHWRDSYNWYRWSWHATDLSTPHEYVHNEYADHDKNRDKIRNVDRCITWNGKVMWDVKTGGIGVKWGGRG